MLRRFFLVSLLYSSVSLAAEKYNIGIISNVAISSDGTHAFNSPSRYVDAINTVCGANYNVLIIPPQSSIDAESYVQNLDGVIAPGNSNDIDPKYYGQEITSSSVVPEEFRTDTDIAIIKAVVKARKPFLGICAGAQALNVAFGGTLIQDIASTTNSTINHNQGLQARAHEVVITNGSVISKAIFANRKSTGDAKITVNSAHHQAILKLGKGLVKTASGFDGITEAIEIPGQKFIIGVQWHPEVLASKEDQNLIKSFCDAIALNHQKPIIKLTNNN